MTDRRRHRYGKTWHQAVAANLTKKQAAAMLCHLDRGDFIPSPLRAVDQYENRVKHSLLGLGLLRFAANRLGATPLRASTTVLTDDGREVLCFLLAEYAEALLAAGYEIGRGPKPPAIAAVACRVAPSVVSAL